MSSQVRHFKSQRQLMEVFEEAQPEKMAAPEPSRHSKAEKVFGRNFRIDSAKGHEKKSLEAIRATCSYPECTKTLRLVDTMIAFKGETYCQKHRFHLMRWIMSEQQMKKK